MSNQQPLLSVQGISLSYSGRQVLRDLSFELMQGEVLALLGPNGSGKSTLMKVIAGLQSPQAGTVKYLGTDVATQSLSWRAARVAYVGADISAQFPMTAQQAVLLGRSCLRGGGLFRLSTSEDLKAVEEAMKRCFCWELRERDLHTLSGGERQLVAIARALVQGARVLFLDESLSRMDLNHQAAMGKLLTELAAQGFGILLVSHDINVASEWSRSALLIRQGARVAFGPIREVLNEANIKALYPGAELVVGANPVSGAPQVFFAGATWVP